VATTVQWATHDKVIIKTTAASPGSVGSGPTCLPTPRHVAVGLRVAQAFQHRNWDEERTLLVCVYKTAVIHTPRCRTEILSTVQRSCRTSGWLPVEGGRVRS
jgi:hypothetical protein